MTDFCNVYKKNYQSLVQYLCVREFPASVIIQQQMSDELMNDLQYLKLYKAVTERIRDVCKKATLMTLIERMASTICYLITCYITKVALSLSLF